MEQQNEILTDKTSMTDDSIGLNKSSSLLYDPVVNRTRKILLILVVTLLVLGLTYFIFILHSYAATISPKSQLPNNSAQLVSILIYIVYYSFGLLVIYRYYQTGLFVFAWLGSVSLILILAIAMVILIGIIVATSRLGFVNGIIVAIIFIIIFLTASLLQVFTVRYAFILSKLLKSTKRLATEQI
ncbi:unnamed protein product [Rotaria sp. Silwood1]|nr:unnamed protein product [Rotaria sp. Silwood1]CAF3334976.1 unnamed protein product [Rotaria sp. Silwood1]CAF3336720.1 unnamed protein product [Rotaria sp. Silwood1]CAF4542703.1 unnamed protein product [Rotaria sp. Silwood1]CAF4809279.1 unnamed protein product [Rotaria sp. Silwood1]